MEFHDDDSTWPPTNLAEYFQSARFLDRLKVLQRRLERHHQHVDSETIVFDAATDLLVKEIENYNITNSFMIKYASESDFFHYLYKVSCKKIIDNARSFQRKFRQLQDEDNVADTRLSPEELAINNEDSSQINKIVTDLYEKTINKLPKIDRVILKHRLDGQTLQEIAEQLDIGVTTVHRRYKSIIKQLANELEGRFESQATKPTP